MVKKLKVKDSLIDVESLEKSKDGTHMLILTLYVITKPGIDNIVVAFYYFVYVCYAVAAQFH